MENIKLSHLQHYLLVLLLLVKSPVTSGDHKFDKQIDNLYSIIYYGDSDVNVGESFTITCIISLSERIEWYKDGELIKKHLRHAKDENSYIETISIHPGDEHKVEATLHVNEAIPKHGGKYQCNKLYKNFHTLRVHNHKDRPDEYFESFPYTPIKEIDNFTPVDESNVGSDEEIIKPTTRHHHHHTHKNFIPIPDVEDDDKNNNSNDNIDDDDFNMNTEMVSPITKQSDLSTESYLHSGTSFTPHTLTTILIDNGYSRDIDDTDDEDYENEKNQEKSDNIDEDENDDDDDDDDDKLLKENELPKNEKMTNTESNNFVIIDETEDTTIVTEETENETTVDKLLNQSNLDNSMFTVTTISNTIRVIETTLPITKISSPSMTTSTTVEIPHTEHTKMGNILSFKFTDKDDQSNNVKTFDLRSSIVLTCVTHQNNSETVTWKKDGRDISEFEKMKSRVQIIKDENTLIIHKSMEEDSGNYSCSTPNGDEKSVEVISNLFVKVPSNVYVSEEDKIVIQCTILGFEPTVWWTIGDKEYRESEDRIILSDGDKKIKNSQLVIEKATLDDRNDYYCKATNKALDVKQIEASDKAFVRVKGKLAALWPFIGICAEVVVLCAIILIYEKRRNKTEADESDTDQSPEQKSDHREKASNVRHKK